MAKKQKIYYVIETDAGVFVSENPKASGFDDPEKITFSGNIDECTEYISQFIDNFF